MLIYLIIGVLVLLYSIQEHVEKDGAYEVSAVDIINFWGVITLWPVTVILMGLKKVFNIDISKTLFKIGDN